MTAKSNPTPTDPEPLIAELIGVEVNPQPSIWSKMKVFVTNHKVGLGIVGAFAAGAAAMVALGNLEEVVDEES